MSAQQLPKFAVITHVAPSSCSGQAVVLDRILRGFKKEEYIVISLEHMPVSEGSSLPCRFFRLGSLPRFPYLEMLPVLSWLLHLINAMLLIPLRAIQMALRLRHEGVERLVACSGNLYLIPATALVARLSGKPLTLYLFDDYIFQWSGFPRRLASFLEKFSMKFVDSIIVPNEFIQKIYRERYNVQASIVRNPCQVSDYENKHSVTAPGKNAEVTVVYAGSIYHAHYDSFHNLISALEMLKDLSIKLHIYTSQRKSKLASFGIGGPFVVYHPHIPSSQVPEILSQADILYLPLAFKTTIPEVIKTSSPGKMGEYLSSGVPVLVHAPQDSFISWFFRRNACGFVVDRPDVTFLMETIRTIICDRTRVAESVKKARLCAESDFDIGSVRQKFRAAIGDNAE